MKYQNVSTARFIGNKFSSDYLTEIYSDEVSITDLKTFKNQTFKSDPNETIFDSFLIDDKNLRIEFFSIKNYERIERSETFAIHRTGEDL